MHHFKVKTAKRLIVSQLSVVRCASKCTYIHISHVTTKNKSQVLNMNAQKTG